jgi:hypothetical protein
MDLLQGSNINQNCTVTRQETRASEGRNNNCSIRITVKQTL